MSTALHGFDNSNIKQAQASRLFFSGLICAAITPCLVGLALSWKLNHWTVGESSFRLW